MRLTASTRRQRLPWCVCVSQSSKVALPTWCRVVLLGVVAGRALAALEGGGCGFADARRCPCRDWGLWRSTCVQDSGRPVWAEHGGGHGLAAVCDRHLGGCQRVGAGTPHHFLKHTPCTPFPLPCIHPLAVCVSAMHVCVHVCSTSTTTSTSTAPSSSRMSATHCLWASCPCTRPLCCAEQRACAV